jgi:hypothetical protein
VKPQENGPSAEIIPTLLRVVEELIGNGLPVSDAVILAGLSEVQYYKMHLDYGERPIHQIKLMSRLAAENLRLRNKVTELMLDKLDLQDQLATQKPI